MKSRILKICFGVLSVSSILFGAVENRSVEITPMVETLKKSIDTLAESKINSLDKYESKKKECNPYLEKVDKLFTSIELLKGDGKIGDNYAQAIQAYSLYATSLMKRYELCEKKYYRHLN